MRQKKIQFGLYDKTHIEHWFINNCSVFTFVSRILFHMETLDARNNSLCGVFVIFSDKKLSFSLCFYCSIDFDDQIHRILIEIVTFQEGDTLRAFMS